MREPAAASPFEAAQSADEVIARLGMMPIPEEGAWFAPGPRTTGLNGITALLTDRPDGFSAMHRLTIDEGWQWLAGAPATLLRLHPDGTGDTTTLGPDEPQALVPRGSWMGASTHGAWTLISCWCAPAFEPEHFELGGRDVLAAEYPDHAAQITALTRDHPTGRMR